MSLQTLLLIMYALGAGYYTIYIVIHIILHALRMIWIIVI